MKASTRLSASKVTLKIVVTYATFSILWLWFSDRALAWLQDPHTIVSFAFLKGVIFVALTSIALYALLIRAIHQLTTAEGELKRSEDRLRSLFDHMLDGLVDCQLLFNERGQACDYIYLDANQSYYRLTGQVDVKDRKASEIYPGLERLNPELIQLFARVVATGKPETAEIFFKPRQRWLNFSVFRPSQDGDKFAVIFQDTTEKRRREEEEQARLAVDAASKMKNEFVANVSHEIRTPLNAILGLTYLALQGEKDERQRDYLEKIHKAGQGLLALVNDVLDFSKVDEGQLTLESTEFQLYDVLENVSNALAQIAFDKGLDLVIAVAPNVPTRIQGDPLRLGQILMNLLSNAVKFTDHGQVALQITRAGEFLKFTVRDSGIGIDETQRKALFQAFTQGDASITRKYGGTGLGLAISQRLAHLMGGSIEAESQPGLGSTFCLELPCSDSQVELDPDLDDSLRPLKGARALLVDDDPPGARVLSQTLEKIEVDVTVLNFAELANHKTQGYDFALIQNGAHSLSQIAHRLPNLARRRILIVKPGADSMLAQNPGFDCLLVKPVLLPKLRDAMLGTIPPSRVASPESIRIFEPARILVAEDHPVNQQVIRELLERAGLTVDIADDGQQAVDMLLADQTGRWQAVLMDLQMPVLDGYQATQQIRQLDHLIQLPILALSGHVLPEERQKCLDAGLTDYIAKPIVPETLFAKLAQWLPTLTPDNDAPPSGETTQPVDLVAIGQVIKTLDRQLSNFEGAAIDSVDTLASLLRPLGPQPALAQLRKEIRLFEFDGGRAALERLCEQLEIDGP